MEKYSTIKIRENNESKKVRISSDVKPEILENLINKWQSLIDTAAQMAEVPAGLIMRLNEKTIEVFVRSNTDNNPYERGEEAKLIYGLYCETVIGVQKKLLVPDATKSAVWKKNNPDVDINMISYLGYPINWPDGEVFGTVCILDSKENSYNKFISNFVYLVKQHIETDLQLLSVNNTLSEKNEQLGLLNNTKTRFLSIISHDLRTKIGTAGQMLKLIDTGFETMDKSELRRLIKSLSKSINTSYNLLENLLLWAKSDFLRMEPEKKGLNIGEQIDTVIHEFSDEIKQKFLKVEREYSSSCNLEADENMLFVIIRNILSNAIKFSNENGKIIIRIQSSDNGCILEFEDRGAGMNKALVENLFTYDKTNSGLGTGGESGAGIGLILVKEFLDKHNAEIQIDSEAGRGTIFRILWPD